MGTLIDISGNRFGMLTVIGLVGRQAFGRKLYIWECKCDCGKTIEIPKNYLTSGDTKSCGCLALKVRKEMHFKHGSIRNRLYVIWTGMKQRCYNQSCAAYVNYGGRGITICKKWRLSFLAFNNDMLSSYQEGYTLERINNNGNYTKLNTKWIKKGDQSKNTRSVIMIRNAGKKQSVTDWCKELNIDRALVFQRLSRGWLWQDAISLPKQKNQFFKSKINP